MRTGIDIVEIARIKKAIERTPSFLEKTFSENEIKYFTRINPEKKEKDKTDENCKSDSVENGQCTKENKANEKIIYESAAACFAAKEAYGKMTGKGLSGLRLNEIELCHDSNGAPYLALNGERLPVSVSISHDCGIAVAIVFEKDSYENSNDMENEANRQNKANGESERSIQNAEIEKIEKNVCRLIPQRKEDAHKGDCGKLFVLAGSKGMTGAAALCAKAALRSGAGLLTVGTADSQQPIIATKLTEAMTASFKSKNGQVCLLEKDKILAAAETSDAFVIGPGMGRENETAKLIRFLALEANVKTLIDADGLNAIAANIDILKKRKAETVLTPHEGEAARLLNKTAENVKRNRLAAAKEIAKRSGAVAVLKGSGTIVTDGERFFVNPTGNPGMATGGSGDVLSGIIGSFLAQGLYAYDAAVLGVYIHGLAGDFAAREKTEFALIASDIIESLPNAFSYLLRKG